MALMLQGAIKLFSRELVCYGATSTRIGEHRTVFDVLAPQYTTGISSKATERSGLANNY